MLPSNFHSEIKFNNKLFLILSSNTFILAILALSIEEEVEIIITPASIPMITITTSSSIKVNDFCLFLIIIS